MGRRRRSSRRDLVRLTPWVLGSGGFALAVVALQLAGPRLQLAGFTPAALGVLVAVLLALAALVALAWRRHRRGAAGPAAQALGTRHRRQFELRLAEGFRAQGYQIVPNGTGGPVDLVLRRDRGNLLVNCRHWQADKLGIEVLRELHAVVVARGAAGGLVVCQGRFSREAQRFAAGSALRLIDGPALALLLPP